MSKQQQQQVARANNGPVITRVQVHASVVLSIIDHHMRKPATLPRVIGTLLGVNHGGGVIEVTTAYAVPHAEKEREVAIGKDFNRQMKALTLKTNPGETVVGWYSTFAGGSASSPVDAKSCFIHDYYSSSECGNALHVVVDLSRPAKRVETLAFYSVALGVAGARALGAEFRPVPVVESIASAPERIALAALQRKSVTQEEAVAKLVALLDEAHARVEESKDETLAKRLAELMTSVDLATSNMASAQLNRALQDAIQDLTMVVQLSKLAKSQLVIGEKLSAVI